MHLARDLGWTHTKEVSAVSHAAFAVERADVPILPDANQGLGPFRWLVLVSVFASGWLTSAAFLPRRVGQ